MSLIEIILIAVGLSMDAFAVSITLGLSVSKPKTSELLIPGIYFGFFQALMPAVGFFAGFYFAGMVDKFEHWIAFILLCFIGGKMIKDSFDKDAGENKSDENAFKFTKMLVLAVATSIDALAVGVTYAFYKVNILAAALLTGVITFIISVFGVKIGNIFGIKYKSKAELAGGIILVLLGIKFLVEHFLKN
ncbi:MAG: manganese efflux pump MntP family protein [Treponema sp.]|nr:manganese efflux pump MntP family protein [Treponema sp.]